MEHRDWRGKGNERDCLREDDETDVVERDDRLY